MLDLPASLQKLAKQELFSHSDWTISSDLYVTSSNVLCCTVPHSQSTQRKLVTIHRFIGLIHTSHLNPHVEHLFQHVWRIWKWTLVSNTNVPQCCLLFTMLLQSFGNHSICKFLIASYSKAFKGSVFISTFESQSIEVESYESQLKWSRGRWFDW